MIRERQLTLSYGNARYLESGRGWPLVLLHAFPLGADMWRPQLEAVQDGCRIVAPDLRGFGGDSERPARSMDEFAAGVLELLDALKIDRAALGGLSMGGYVAFALLRMEPQRFSALVLADTRASADSVEGRAGRERMLELVRRRGVDAVAEDMLPKLLADTSRQQQPELDDVVRTLIRRNSTSVVAGAIEALRDRPDSTPLLKSIQVPTLVLVGEEDGLTPPDEARSMQAEISRSRLVLLPRAGHLSNLEAPDLFSRAVNDFLTSPL